MGQSFGRAFGTTVEELKNQINIVDVVGRVVPLKRAGANYKGVCPFHSEKTPSFVVSEQKQIFTCFGCGASGDVIEFTKRYYNLDFAEAVEKLANDQPLEERYCDHALEGNWKGHRELHIRPDWLLIYQIKDDVLILELSRTGTHSDLFGK